MVQPDLAPQPIPETQSSIIFYDGQCGLCDRFVRFVLRRDPACRFQFAPLQGETFAKLSSRQPNDFGDTMILADSAGLHTRSTAALRVLRQLDRPWSSLARVAAWVPRPLRDLLYRIVARLRHWLFRPPEVCVRPASADRTRFLP